MKVKNIIQKSNAVYHQYADLFDDLREKTLIEKPWLDRFLSFVKNDKHILDLGCGTGDPIARYLLDHGYNVTGIDQAQNMIDLAQRNFPNATWKCQDINNLSVDGLFDGIVAWHSFFHLSQDQQRETLPKICALLKPDAPLLMTMGYEAGETVGYIGTHEVYHASLDEQEYHQILSQSGMQIEDYIKDDPSCSGATVLLAVK